MTNGPCAIFISVKDPELIEEKEQSIIKKGEKQNDEEYGAVVEYHDSVKVVTTDYNKVKIYKYGSEVVTYQRTKY